MPLEQGKKRHWYRIRRSRLARVRPLLPVMCVSLDARTICREVSDTDPAGVSAALVAFQGGIWRLVGSDWGLLVPCYVDRALLGADVFELLEKL